MMQGLRRDACVSERCNVCNEESEEEERWGVCRWEEEGAEVARRRLDYYDAAAK